MKENLIEHMSTSELEKYLSSHSLTDIILKIEKTGKETVEFYVFDQDKWTSFIRHTLNK